MPASDLKIKLENLVKAYGGRRVVDGISLEVSPGEVVGLLGQNGAGKTTTFYMIVGVVKPTSGRVFLGEKDLTRLPMHKRARLGLGYLSQEQSVFRGLTVEENIQLVWEMLGVPRKKRDEELPGILERFGLLRLGKEICYKLSGGERRRVELARAMATHPSFLLLDEPFTGIDPIAISEIQEIVSELKSQKIGILITDHNVRETLHITDRAYIINDGKILVQGSSKQIAEDPTARKHYLGEKFSL
ncbi:MAG: LPS export ABC transporter ATP-binding protein [Firmicutes bacterium]|nr:LPS export ABC transporter ATP-binding protein [Bacillota bacterium]